MRLSDLIMKLQDLEERGCGDSTVLLCREESVLLHPPGQNLICAELRDVELERDGDAVVVLLLEV